MDDELIDGLLDRPGVGRKPVMTTTAPRSGRPHPNAPDGSPSRLPGVLLGVGLGGFIDGIVLHQILQWHHMVSHTEDNPTDTVAGLQTNVLADGFFHVATWVFVFVGLLLSLRSWQQGRLAPSWRFQLGLVLLGWGVFNVVEGIVNHHVLQIHHVRDDLGAPLAWDLGFLVFGAVLMAGGWAVHRSGDRDGGEADPARRSDRSCVPTARGDRG